MAIFFVFFATYFPSICEGVLLPQIFLAATFVRITCYPHRALRKEGWYYSIHMLPRWAAAARTTRTVLFALCFFLAGSAGILLISSHPVRAFAAPLQINRPLQVGATGTDVSALQVFLQNSGYFHYPTITGYYGPVTWKAVAAFQWDNKLDPVGYVGPRTRSLLAALTRTTPQSPSTPTTGASSIPSTSNAATTTAATSTAQFSTPLPGYAPGQIIFIGGGGSPTTPATIPDTTPPSVSLTVPSANSTVGGSSVTLTATASDNVAVANVQFKVDSSNIGSAITSSPYTASWNSTGVVDGSHTLYAVAKDSSGNYATSSIAVTVRNSAPAISAVSFGFPGLTIATTTWITDETANSQVNYGTTTSYASSTVLDGAYVTSHQVVLSGLSPSTTYHFQVVSTDVQGHLATSTDQTLTTPPIVSVGALGASSQISGSTLTSYTNSAFTYWGGTIGSSIYNTSNLNKSDGLSDQNKGFYVEFNTNADQFEVPLYTDGNLGCGSYQLFVNGQPASTLANVYGTSSAANTANKVLFTFPDAEQRTIRILTDAQGFGGVIQKSAFTLSANPHTVQKTLVVLGDSWVGGNNSGCVATNFQFQLASLLGYDNVVSLGEASTGYLNNGGGGARGTFASSTRIAMIAAQHPTAVLIVGSVNDVGQPGEPASLTAAASSTYAQIAAALPGVPVVVVGSQYVTQLSSANYSFLDSAIQAAATSSPNVMGFVSLSGSITGTVGCNVSNPCGSQYNASIYVTSDGRHLNAQGAYYFANWLAPKIKPYLP
ncbi:Ig-like domain-containing protein [Bradyrhizobium sp. LTSPM299]|uniref:Ig-like domain-containing protein n=1 Tax=Bradyrhizobium sp. LTSPM299 TaxID=1619233 RepID=UPI0012E26542|nr:Ig-like domain-containing protein [Bradyrhizobium sp. LTSPM299]